MNLSDLTALSDDELDAERDRLWDLLVPSEGCAKTTNGEFLRCAGRIWHDHYNNGRCNMERGSYLSKLASRFYGLARRRKIIAVAQELGIDDGEWSLLLMRYTMNAPRDVDLREWKAEHVCSDDEMRKVMRVVVASLAAILSTQE